MLLTMLTSSILNNPSCLILTNVIYSKKKQKQTNKQLILISYIEKKKIQFSSSKIISEIIRIILGFKLCYSVLLLSQWSVSQGGHTCCTRVTANTLDHAINPYCYRLYRVDIFHYSMQQFKPRNRLNHFRTEGKT